jgi:serine/threonine protein kinase
LIALTWWRREAELSEDDKLHQLFEKHQLLPDSDRPKFLKSIRTYDTLLADRLESLIADEAPTNPSGPANSPDESIGLESSLTEVAMADIVERLAKTRPKESRYELRGEIARGGMGAIIKVWDKTLRRTLAMKVALGKEDPDKPGSTPAIDERTLGRFLDEAQVTGQLDHPGIVPVYELGVDDDGQVYFTMRMVKGQTLSDIFDFVKRGEEGWTQSRVLGVILKVCEAMAYAHSKNVIHRDLKPANIMVGRFGEVYVMDWGLARVLGKDDSRDIRVRPDTTASIHSARRDVSNETPDSPLLTMNGDVVGTPAYMSPEQATGLIEAMGAHSDVYAVGAILYQLLAGHMPYVPPGALLNNYAVWSRVQEGPPAPIEQVAKRVSPELLAVCKKAMQRETEERYPDMITLGDELRACMEKGVVRALSSTPLGRMRGWWRRQSLLIRVGAILFYPLSILIGALDYFSIIKEPKFDSIELSSLEWIFILLAFVVVIGFALLLLAAFRAKSAVQLFCIVFPLATFTAFDLWHDPILFDDELVFDDMNRFVASLESAHGLHLTQNQLQKLRDIGLLQEDETVILIESPYDGFDQNTLRTMLTNQRVVTWSHSETSPSIQSAKWADITHVQFEAIDPKEMPNTYRTVGVFSGETGLPFSLSTEKGRDHIWAEEMLRRLEWSKTDAGFIMSNLLGSKTREVGFVFRFIDGEYPLECFTVDYESSANESSESGSDER